MSASRWLARGAWGTAYLDRLVVDDGCLVLGQVASGFARRGVALVPAGAPDPAQRDSTTDDRWRQVGVRLAEPLPADAWLRVWTRVEAHGATPPLPAARGELSDDAPPETPVGKWRPAAVDALDARVLCRAEGVLWVAVELGGRGAATARIADVVVHTGDDGPVTHLPVVYRATSSDPLGARDDVIDGGDGLLGRYLGLLSAHMQQTSSLLDELPALLAPAVAPDRDDAAWIDRLAAWVALTPEQLPPRSDGVARRDAVEHAVQRHGRRGTPEGIRSEIARRTAIDTERIEIDEPLLRTEIWRLDADPATSALGSTTGLLLADPGPPVLDSTAYLDRSALIAPDDAGLSVHAPVAHRLCVRVADGTPVEVAAVDAVVQAERPAHVWARTCAVAHETGVPCIVGVDALPPCGPSGLADDLAHPQGIDGPGARIGSARLPHESDPPHPQRPTTQLREREGEVP